jgi:hypothetical protein
MIRQALIALAESMLLAGCAGPLWPPKPLPDWAKSAQAKPVDPRARGARVTSKRRLPDRTVNASNVTTANAHGPELLPFSPAWQAREEAFDTQLRRSMNICRGC